LKHESSLASIAIGLVLVALTSGRCDDWILFSFVSFVFGVLVALKCDHLNIQEVVALELTRTNVVESAGKQIGIQRLDRHTEQILFCVGVVIVAGFLAMLMRSTLSRYSPAMGVAFYCACVCITFRDESSQSFPASVVVLSCMLVLSLASNYIFRLHVAVSLFCLSVLMVDSAVEFEYDDETTGRGIHVLADALKNPGPNNLSAIKFLLVIGYGACVVHDFVSFLFIGMFLRLIHVIYVASVATITCQGTLELLSRVRHVPKWMVPSQERLREIIESGRLKKLSTTTWVDIYTSIRRLDPYNLKDSATPGTIVCCALLFCICFSVVMAGRCIFSNRVAWRWNSTREVVVLPLFLVVIHGTFYVIFGPEKLLKILVTPVYVTAQCGVIYSLLSGICESVNTKRNHFFCMEYFRNAYWENVSNEAPAGEPILHAGGELRPPPFVLMGKDDKRISLLSEEVNKYTAQYRASFQKVQVLTTKQATKGKDEAVYKDIICDIAMEQSHAACLISKAAYSSENVALHLRELVSDAETERDILRSVRHYSRLLCDTESQNVKRQAIKRQTDNALTTFMWLREEMEQGETNAENLLDTARLEIRSAVKYIAKAKFTLEGIEPYRKKLDDALNLIRSEVSPFIMDVGSMDQYLEKQMKLLCNEGVDQTSTRTETAAATPYERALLSKHGKLSDLDRDALRVASGGSSTFTGEESLGTISSQASKRKRWFHVFQRWKRSKSKTKKEK